MVLWNRAASSSGGITNRTGGNTEEIYKKEAAPAPSQEQVSSSKKSWWSKAGDWLSNHSEGVGKVVGGLASAIGAGVGAYVGKGATGASVGMGIAKAGKDILGGIIGEDSKFAKGLTNTKINEGADKIDKAYSIYKDNTLDKVAKINEFNKLMGTNINTSNGHVPVGYQAASSQGATVPSGSIGLRKAVKKFEQKVKKPTKAKKGAWGEDYLAKRKGKNKKGKKK